eukprot:g854.t1
MRQKNLQSGKLRPIRTPPTWVAEERLGGAASPRCLAVVVPEGGPGSCIYVPNPDREGDFLAVQVPGSARVGHSMLVPLPPSTSPSTSPSTAFTAFAPSAPPPTPSTAAAPSAPPPTASLRRAGFHAAGRGWTRSEQALAGAAY